MFQLGSRDASGPLSLPDTDTFLLTWLCKATPTTRGTFHRQLLVLGPSNERARLLRPYRWIPHNVVRGRRLSFRSFQQRDAVQPLARSSRRRLAALFGQFSRLTALTRFLLESLCLLQIRDSVFSARCTSAAAWFWILTTKNLQTKVFLPDSSSWECCTVCLKRIPFFKCPWTSQLHDAGSSPLKLTSFFVHFSTGEGVKLRGKFQFALDARFRCVGRSGMQALVRRQFFIFSEVFQNSR